MVTINGITYNEVGIAEHGYRVKYHSGNSVTTIDYYKGAEYAMENFGLCLWFILSNGYEYSVSKF